MGAMKKLFEEMIPKLSEKELIDMGHDEDGVKFLKEVFK